MSSVVITKSLAKKLIPSRSVNSKKGDNGIVLVAGGSKFYHGAPVLASMASLRTGADLVYSAIPRSIIGPVRSYSPAIIALPLPDEKLTVGSAGRLVAMMPKKCDSAAIGMGMSIARPEAAITLVKKLTDQGTSLVLDASMLIPEILGSIRGTNCVVTPHAGEFKRLFGIEAGNTEIERIKSTAKMAKENEITVLLKGPTDVVSDSKQTGLNRIHNCAMTVGGTGDVLSGIVAALVAKKMKPFDASLVGVYLNGIAGNLAYEKVGLHMVATDLVDHLAQAMKQFDVIVN